MKKTMCLSVIHWTVQRALFLVGFVTAAFLFTAEVALAFPVPDLPDGNLIQNPWFRSGSDPARPGLDYWTDAAGKDALWSTSQKDSNPSPDGVTGTSARFARGRGQGGGVGQGGVDAYLFQVVSADPAKRKLIFFTHWVTGGLEEASITIYGSETTDGPWRLLWMPLELTPETSSDRVWTSTRFMEETIDTGYPYYKIEIHLRYPVERIQGGKFTGIYFTVVDVSETNPVFTEEILALPAVTSEPSAVPEVHTTPATSTTQPDAERATEVPDSVKTGVILSVTVVSSTQVNLFWSPDPDGRRFRLERSANGTSEWVEIAWLEADVATFTDTEVLPSMSYFYRLRMAGRDGSDDYSNMVAVNTPLQTDRSITVTRSLSPPAATASSVPVSISDNVDGSGEDTARETLDSNNTNATQDTWSVVAWLILPFLILLGLAFWIFRARGMFW